MLLAAFMIGVSTVEAQVTSPVQVYCGADVLGNYPDV